MKYKVRTASRVWVVYIVLVMINFLFLSATLAEQWYIRYPINIGLLVAGFWLVYNEGCYRGERAATLRATLENRRKEVGDSHISPIDESECWDKRTGIHIFLIAMIPFLLFSLGNLLFQSGLFDTLAHQVPPTQNEAQVGVLQASDWANIVAGILFMPFNIFFGMVPRPVLPYVFVALGALFPLAMLIGYMRGPKLRTQKLELIKKGSKRKLRQSKMREQQKRGPKPPKAEV